MLFNKLYSLAKKYPNKLALNSLTYSDLVKKVIDSEYNLVCQSKNEKIIIDIFKASQIQKPLIILPKYNLEDIEMPSKLNKKFDLYLFSSGSTGKRKSICLSEKMIKNNADIAIKCQNITSEDKILTVCSLNHTGGLNAQTIPGLLSGAHIIIKDFNPFKFLKDLKENEITLTHLIPIMISALEKTKNNTKLEKLRLVVAGSDCVYKNHVEYWINKNINFLINYGLTEAGPIIINHLFKYKEELKVYDLGIPIGSNCWCDYKIDKNELILKGKSVYKKDWFNTGDCVSINNGWFIYKGRKSAGCKIVPKNY